MCSGVLTLSPFNSLLLYIAIGTTAPSQKLSVSGSVLANSYLEYSPKYAGDALSKIKDIKCEDGTIDGDWCEIDHNTLPDGLRYENNYNVKVKTGEETIEHEAVYEDRMIEPIEEVCKDCLGATEKVLVKEVYTEVKPIMEEQEQTFVGRDLGKSVQFNLKAIQELLERVESLEQEVKELKSEKTLGANQNTFNDEEVSILRKIINFFKSIL